MHLIRRRSKPGIKPSIRFSYQAALGSYSLTRVRRRILTTKALFWPVIGLNSSPPLPRVRLSTEQNRFRLVLAYYFRSHMVRVDVLSAGLFGAACTRAFLKHQNRAY